MDDGVERRFVEPREVPVEEFPASTWAPEGMRTLEADVSPRHAAVTLGVEYARKSGRALQLQIIQPPGRDLDGLAAEPRLPLVLFVQGSAWQEQKLGLSLVPLIDIAARGYVVAIVQYRPSPVAPFPAQVKDAKTAIRFLRAHADEHGIDPARVVLWGDSSGGHTTVLTYLTEDDQEYSDETVAEPLGVSCYVDYYAPTHIARMNEEPSIYDHLSADTAEGQLIGGHDLRERPDLVAPTVAMNHIDADRRLKPLLIIHGDKDRLVPFAQSALLYEALVEAGQPVDFYRLAGADHGGPAFWTEEVLDLVDAFMQRHLPAT
ncbi:alpha/beta hydrolase [Demequina salsinemoris]|uniref:alpha/beta hydrolase n=1 Tax=Demequina salsinemoris TaxID=577470 RepID=UPI000781657C|nr:alpha/beta hydrolase [Demequina salsinemoris]